jgi:hypothetical protein
MPARTKSAGIAVAAVLSAGSITHTIGLPTSQDLTPQMQSLQRYHAGVRSWKPQLTACSAKDDWTAWDGAMRGTSALWQGH